VRLVREQLLPRPRAEVFPFFADAGNLAELTPGFLRFRILTPLPLRMEAGARLDYRISLFHIPFRWRTRITAWQPDERFTDVQERGPFALWHHLHEFDEREGGTLVRDVVDYRVPLGPAGRLVHALWLRRVLERIFDYRRDVLARRFG